MKNNDVPLLSVSSENKSNKVSSGSELLESKKNNTTVNKVKKSSAIHKIKIV